MKRSISFKHCRPNPFMMHRRHVFIVHRTKNRMRIKIPRERHNVPFFARVQRQLAEHRDIVAIETNPLTASVLIIHREGFDPADLDVALSSRPERSGEPGPHGEKGALLLLRSRVRVRDPGTTELARDDGHALRSRMAAHLDGRLRALSGGEVDLPSLALKIATAIVTRQPVWRVLEWLGEIVLRALFKSLAARAGRVLLSEDHRPEPVLLAAA